MRSIKDLQLDGRAVLMRLDLNVPIKEGKIKSDARIRAALPTVQHALRAGARLALCSHLGRPKDKPDPAFSLEPVAARLQELLDQEVVFSHDCIGDGVRKLVQEQKPGGVILLENVRFHKGEKKNEAAFAKELAAPFEVFINDAFGSCHRPDASIVGVVPLVKDKGAGFLLEKEVAALSKLLENPGKPFIAVIGGAKVEDKVGVLSSLLGRVDALCIGGAMAYTFLKARGDEIGTSKVENDKLHVATEIMDRAKARKVELLLPEDHVVGAAFEETTKPETVAAVAVPKDKMGLDIGPKTREKFAARVRGAKTVFWNGPMGVFEWEAFAGGTMAVAKAMAECQGFTVVGGGDSVAAIEKAKIVDRLGHVSTGGGASLELLEKGTLPGIDALK